ncbi:MAG: hypothetical protein EA384_12265 [Spirochaetaceae bacterium]|nr:MAG: hypothetical protein EA384_12265 [Spirochaetaceae bacterium]
MKLHRIAIVTALLLVFGVALASAQNLLQDNPHAQRARELRRQSEQAIDEGEYNRAYDYALEAQEESRKAREWAEMMLWAYRAGGARNRAQERLSFVRGIDAQTHFPDEYRNAVGFYEEGQQLFGDERYQPSFEAFQSVLAALESVRRVTVAADVLPRYYEVRRIPERRDSFWRIAGYDFVYGNSREWRNLYEANRDMLQDPDNPRLIQPGMLFEIPSIRGERREGVWQPE